MCNFGKCFVSSIICTSFVTDQKKRKGAFQCADNSLILLSQFCDGIDNCADSSDELVKQLGFKCNKCIVPQSNLYDKKAHCVDDSDLCLDENVWCFQCFDKRLLISSKQVCDGVINCHDRSDECLCKKYFDAEMCDITSNSAMCFHFRSATQKSSLILHDAKIDTNNLFIYCKTKYDSIRAAMCDGRPECKDYRDECRCDNPPRFCNDSCFSFFPMGDRYCDGEEDRAWKYINSSLCPKGFDEKWCRKRFKCAAAGKVSIDIRLVCDGKADCDDSSDEKKCPNSVTSHYIFSSDDEMIANPAIKSAFWVMGLVVILGNAYVIITTIKFIRKKKHINGLAFQHIIILNISLADLVMGVYLFAIAICSALYSGIYGTVDREWRSSLYCAIIGSLAVFSSETSCFLMVVLTVFRLMNIHNPIKSRTISLAPWKISLCATWVIAFFLSSIPILKPTSSYFVNRFSFSSKFHKDETWHVTKLPEFSCRFAALSNSTISDYGSDLNSILIFFKDNLLPGASLKLYGYYSETSVCMPRFFMAYGEPSWEYTFSIITLNFISFLFIAVGYFLIYKYSLSSTAKVHHNKSFKKSAKLQKRIARIIATDFCCWLPTCVLAYVRMCGIELSLIIYEITAVLLLPINSAVNPFLFSSLPDKLIKLFQNCYLKYCRKGKNLQKRNCDCNLA